MQFPPILLRVKRVFFVIVLFASVNANAQFAPEFCNCDDGLPRDQYLACLAANGCDEDIPVNESIPLLIFLGVVLVGIVHHNKSKIILKPLSTNH